MGRALLLVTLGLRFGGERGELRGEEMLRGDFAGLLSRIGTTTFGPFDVWLSFGPSGLRQGGGTNG